MAACGLARSTAAYGGLRRRLWGLHYVAQFRHVVCHRRSVRTQRFAPVLSVFVAAVILPEARVPKLHFTADSCVHRHSNFVVDSEKSSISIFETGHPRLLHETIYTSQTDRRMDRRDYLGYDSSAAL